jgi:hypothetical protein
MLGEAGLVEPLGGHDADGVVTGHCPANIVQAIAGGAGQQRDVRDQLLPVRVVKPVVEAAANIAEERGYAGRPVGVLDAADVGDGFHQAHARVGALVGASVEVQVVEPVGADGRRAHVVRSWSHRVMWW